MIKNGVEQKCETQSVKKYTVAMQYYDQKDKKYCITQSTIVIYHY